MSPPDFKFLRDAPIRSTDDGYFDFYHKHIAPSIKSILENESCVHTIGLFGAWGTGKSTIIKALKDEGISNAKMVEFDCWKYQKDSLQRQLLMQIAKDLNLGKGYLNKLIQQFYYDTTEQIGERPQIRWSVLKLQLFLPITLLLWMAVRTFMPEWTTASIILFLLAAIGFVARELLLPDDAKNFISITAINGTKNKIDSPELFEECFSKIINDSGESKVIIVVDNLDRVEREVAIEMLSTLKTFLEINTDGMEDKKIIFLVPCHYEMLRQTLIDTMNPSEYLRKIFNLAIWSPEFINTDLDKYIESLLEKTGEINKLINNEDVILVIKSSFVDNPREIKQFINNFIASLVIALNTEVAAIIKDNPAYLAKILVLRDKFPKEYAELKENWFAPESIETIKSSKDFKRFMLLTSRITTADAETYLYFKKPILAKGLKHENELRTALITGELETSIELVKKEKKKEAVVEYATALIEAYKTQRKNCTTLIQTLLGSFNRLEFEPSKKDFYNSIAYALDEYLWDNYKLLDQTLIFRVLNNRLLDTHLRQKLAERYTLATIGQETVGNEVHAVSVFSNIVSHPQLFSANQKTEIAKAIQQHFVCKPKIISLLSDKEKQATFLNDDALSRFIGHISVDNHKEFVPALLLLKEYLYDRKFQNLIYNVYVKLLQEMDRVKNSEQGEKVLQSLDEIFDECPEVFSKIDDKQKNHLRELINPVRTKWNTEWQARCQSIFSKVQAGMTSK